ncbi:MAG: RDD family protein [Pseudomonadales bacterium]|nr:RDD family protein [Pseudomonadales bacterium]
MSETQFDPLSVKLSYPGKRYQGQFIDTMISLIIFGLTMYIVKTLGINDKVADILILAIPFAYFVLSDALPGGQSLAKRLLKIAVVSKSTGKPCTLLQSVARNVFTPILGVLDAVLILTKKRQRLGDLMANTIVIEKS